MIGRERGVSLHALLPDGPGGARDLRERPPEPPGPLLLRREPRPGPGLSAAALHFDTFCGLVLRYVRLIRDTDKQFPELHSTFARTLTGTQTYNYNQDYSGISPGILTTDPWGL